MEKIHRYLVDEYAIYILPDPDDDEEMFNHYLHKLIEEYGKEQRKEGYMKGFDDGLEDAMVASDTEYKANG